MSILSFQEKLVQGTFNPMVVVWSSPKIPLMLEFARS